MKKYFLSAIILMSLVLAACQAPVPSPETAVIELTQENLIATSSILETEEVSQEVVAMVTPHGEEETPDQSSVDIEEQVTPSPEITDQDALISQPWQWVSFTNPVEAFEIDNPENYVLTFDEDGSVSIQADCNNAIGSYTVDGSSISIEIGPVTMAACPPGSRSDEFLKNLSFAVIYFFDDGHLFIDMFADGGTFEFAPGK